MGTTPATSTAEPTEPSVAPGTGARGPRSRRALAVAVAAGVLVLAALAVVLWPRSSQPPVPAHAPLVPVPSQAVTSVGGQRLLALVAKGASATYHATYTVTGDPSLVGGSLTLEVWQAPPDVREDTVLVHDGQTVHTASFRTGTTGRLCVQQGSGPWSCHEVPAGQATGTGATGMVAAIAATVSGHGVSVSQRSLDGRALTCFTVQVADQPQLCATAGGLAALVADGQVAYRLASLSGDVGQAVFTAPG